MDFVTNIRRFIQNNKNYRVEVFNDGKMQVAILKLEVGEDIPEETHPNSDQMVYVESGWGSVKIGDSYYSIYPGVMFIIPAGKNHYILNDGDQTLRAFTIYSPPE